MQKVLYCSDNRVSIHYLDGGSDGDGNHPWVVLLVTRHKRSLVNPKEKDIEHDTVLAWCSTREEARKIARAARKVIGL